MPSHIFTRLGLWQESVQSNADSAMAAKPDGDAQGQLHAMDYMVYAYLQLGQDGKARGVVDTVRGFGRVERETGATAYAQAAVPARHALEKRRWAEAATLEPTETRYTHVTGITYFARAVGAARGGDPAAARRDVDRLQALREALVQAKQGYWADQVEVQRRAAAGWLARAEGKNDEAVALLRAPADLEDSTEKHPVTPAPVLPAREMLGDLLLELGQARPALVEYEASLRREPNRFKGLTDRFDTALQVMKELPYGNWRERNPEDTIRFYALRLHEAGMIKSSPQKIIARGTDWRFLNELKKELKG